MAIFVAVASLIELVANMTKSRKPKIGASDGKNPEMEGGGGPENKDIDTKCPKKAPTSSTQQPEEEGEDDGDFLDMGDMLPTINLNAGEEEEDTPNEPGKSFLELLFGFILDPVTAIIKGIIQMVKLAIVTTNIAINLNRCAKWFVIYVFCTLVYIPISMLFALLNLTKLEKKIGNIIGSLDTAIFCIIEKIRGPGQGFHISRFSDDIREICFLETVKPTNCSSGGSKKKKKKKKFNLSKFLGAYLFLFLVILFVCLMIFTFGRKNVENIPMSFLVFFAFIVFTILFMAISPIINYVLLFCTFLILPLSLWAFSFVFGYIPSITFSFFSKEKNYESPFLNNFKYFIVDILAAFFLYIASQILKFPKPIQYIIGGISIFIIITTAILALSSIHTLAASRVV